MGCASCARWRARAAASRTRCRRSSARPPVQQWLSAVADCCSRGSPERRLAGAGSAPGLRGLALASELRNGWRASGRLQNRDGRRPSVAWIAGLRGRPRLRADIGRQATDRRRARDDGRGRGAMRPASGARIRSSFAHRLLSRGWHVGLARAHRVRASGMNESVQTRSRGAGGAHPARAVVAPDPAVSL